MSVDILVGDCVDLMRLCLPNQSVHCCVTSPPDLIEPCVLAGCPVGGTVLDPFGGAGTTGLVAQRHGRNAVLCEINPGYAALAEARMKE
jgi:DNA modification methylase